MSLAALTGPWAYLAAIPILATLIWATTRWLNRTTGDLTALADAVREHPPAGDAPPPRRSPNPRPAGHHQAPHNPFVPGTITFAKPCGCRRTIDELTGRTIYRFTCNQAADWDQWQKELSEP